GAALYDREGEVGTRNAERGTGNGTGLCGVARAFPRGERRHAGWLAARLARSLAPRATVEHGADHSADRRSAHPRAGPAARRRRTASMCGIVGYTGPRQAAALLLEGLKRLEYRGYGSAGIALVADGRIEVHKAPGKIGALEKQLGTTLPAGHAGIAHTRWATHGAPNTVNPHPPPDSGGTPALAHNGIIETAGALRTPRPHGE